MCTLTCSATLPRTSGHGSRLCAASSRTPSISWAKDRMQAFRTGCISPCGPKVFSMQKSRMHRASSLEQDDFSSNRHPALGLWLRMSFSQNRFHPRVKPEGRLLRDMRYRVSEDREETFHGVQVRHSRPLQCGQIDPVQRADGDCGGAGVE